MKPRPCFRLWSSRWNHSSWSRPLFKISRLTWTSPKNFPSRWTVITKGRKLSTTRNMPSKLNWGCLVFRTSSDVYCVFPNAIWAFRTTDLLLEADFGTEYFKFRPSNTAEWHVLGQCHDNFDSVLTYLSQTGDQYPLWQLIVTRSENLGILHRIVRCVAKVVPLSDVAW